MLLLIGKIYVIIHWRWFKMTVAEFDRNISIYREPLYKFILVKCKFNETLAEDIVQITFIKAFKFLSKQDIRSETFKSWLYTIATNCLMTYYRSKNNNNYLYGDFSVNESEDGYLECFDEFKTENFDDNLIDKLILEDIITNGFEELKNSRPDMYEVFMEALDGKDYNSIALDHNIPENTVKTKIFRARKFLQKYLEKKNFTLDLVSQ